MELIMLGNLLPIFVYFITCGISCTSAVYFEEEPRDAEVIQGGLVILRCTVTDIGDASVYWRYWDNQGSLVPLTENRNIERYAQYHGELTKRLSIKGDPNHGEYNLLISNLTLEDQGEYVCSVITNAGQAHDSRRATVVVRPRHPINPSTADPLPACTVEVVSTPRIFQIGSVARFTCATPSGYPARPLAWTKVGATRTLLVSCPNSPCIRSQVLSLDDVNTTFVCELADVTNRQNNIECTFTPLELKIGVVVDPPVYNQPPGQRHGFLCLPVNYSPLYLAFHWYLGSELVSNGTSKSLLNLVINREDTGSRLSCIISTLNGEFRGIGYSSIQPFNPSDVFPDFEGSASPVVTSSGTDNVIPDKRNFGIDNDSNGSDDPLSYSTTKNPSRTHAIVITPDAGKSNRSDSSNHLSILVIVSAIAGALVTLLICAIGLIVLLFVRKRRKDPAQTPPNGKLQESVNKPKEDFEMDMFAKIRRENSENNKISKETVSQQQCNVSDDEGTSDMFYVTLDPDSDEQYADGTLCKHKNEAQDIKPDAARSSVFGPPCTPNDYARPSTRPLEISDQLHKGMINQGFSKSHERTLSDSSASAYAVTDLVSQEGRFMFKGMTGRDEADIGVCRHQPCEGSATMSGALGRHQSAPPLPARTLPQTASMPSAPKEDDDSFSRRRQSDSDTSKDKAASRPSSSFARRWLWSGKSKKVTSPTSEVIPDVQDMPQTESEKPRPLSFGSGGSGDYAEIVSVDSSRSGNDHRREEDGDSTYLKRNSTARDRLDSIPERSAMTDRYQDMDAYASSLALREEQPIIGKDTTTESGYDRLARPNLVSSSPPKRPSPIPIYAKVQKSKSLDHEGSRKKTARNSALTGNSDSGSKARTGASTLQRSKSESAAPPPSGRKAKSVCGYETVVAEKLDNILIQMRNGFPGETIDVPEGEGKDINVNKGTHFANIV